MKEYAAIFVSLLIGITAHHEVHLVPAHKICPDVTGDHDILLPDPKDCSVYYRCENGKAIPQSCPPGLAWCQILQNCTLPILANCTLSHTIVTYSPEELVTYNPNSTTTEKPVTGPTTSSETCPKDGASFPNPKDCRKYYKCKKGKPHSEQCHGKKRYAAWLGICTAPEIANCINVGTQVNKTCPVNGRRNVYPSDCSKYYECVGNTVEIKQCPNGEKYNNWFEDCYSPKLAYCHRYTTVSPTTLPTATQTPGPDNTCPEYGYKLPNPLNCTTYYVCENNSPTLQNCPAGFEYSCWDQECLPPSDGHCLPTQGQSCKNSGKKVPNSQDCHSYFECKNGITVKKDCKKHLQYNPWYGKCVHPNVAHCKVKGTTTPTTSTNSPHTPTPSGTSDICPIDGAKLPDIFDCHSYYICKNETPIKKMCPQYMEYSCWDQECLPAESANCINKMNQTGHACKNDSTTMPNINDCSSYYKCKNGEVALENCDNGLEFNDWYGKCVNSSLSHCNRRTTENVHTTPTTKETPNSSGTTAASGGPSEGSSETTAASGGTSRGSTETTAASGGTSGGSTETTAASDAPSGGSTETTAASGGSSGGATETTAASGRPTGGSSSVTPSILCPSQVDPEHPLIYPSSKYCNAYMICDKNRQLKTIECNPSTFHYNCETKKCENTTHCCSTTTQTMPPSTKDFTTSGSFGTSEPPGGSTESSSETTASNGSTGNSSEPTAASSSPTGSFTETTAASGAPSGGSTETTAASAGPSEGSTETTTASGGSSESSSETTTASGGSSRSSSETTAVSGGPNGSSSETTAASGAPSAGSTATTAASAGPSEGSTETTTASGGSSESSSETTTASGGSSGSSSETTAVSGGPNGSSSETTAASGAPSGGSTATTSASAGPSEGSTETTTASGGSSESSSETTKASGGSSGSSSETTAVSGGPNVSSSETTAASGAPSGGTTATTAASAGPSEGSTETTTASGGSSESSSETTTASGGSSGSSSETTASSGRPSGGSTETTAASGGSSGSSSETTAASGGPNGSSSETTAASGAPSEGSTETTTASGGSSESSSETTTASGGSSGSSSETTASSSGPNGSSSETTAASGAPSGGSTETTAASAGPNGSSSETTAASGAPSGGSTATTAASAGPSEGSTETTTASGGSSESSSETTTASGGPNGSSSETTAASGAPSGGSTATTTASGGSSESSSETTTASGGSSGSSSETTAASGEPNGSSSETTAASGAPSGGSTETTAASGGPNGSSSETTAASGAPSGGSTATTAASAGPSEGSTETTTASGGSSESSSETTTASGGSSGSSSETTAASGGPNGSSSETTAASGAPSGGSTETTAASVGPNGSSSETTAASGAPSGGSTATTAASAGPSEGSTETTTASGGSSESSSETTTASGGSSRGSSSVTPSILCPPQVDPEHPVIYPSSKYCNAYMICDKNRQLKTIECNPSTFHYNCETKKCENTTHCCSTTTQTMPPSTKDFTTSGSTGTSEPGGSTESSSETTASNGSTGNSSEPTAASSSPTGSSTETTTASGAPSGGSTETTAASGGPNGGSSETTAASGGPSEGSTETTAASRGPSGGSSETTASSGRPSGGSTETTAASDGPSGGSSETTTVSGGPIGGSSETTAASGGASGSSSETIAPTGASTDPTSPTEENDVCPVEGALLPNPIDCSTYYKCINGTPSLEKCPDGKKYSCWVQHCELDSEATCVSEGGQNGQNCSVEGLRIIDITNCNNYYECHNGTTILKHCPHGKEFNANFKKCYKPKLAHCHTYSTITPLPVTETTSPTPTISPNSDICPVNGALLPNPLNCSAYYKCINGTPTPELCADGYEYSCWNQVCEPAGEAQCITNGIKNNTSCKYNGQKIQNPEDCHSYYECVNGKVKLKHCLLKWFYNRWFHICVPFSILGHCKPSTITIPPTTLSTTTPKPSTNDLCPKDGALLPNPIDCRGYYKCVNSQPTPQKCPSGQEYSCWNQKCEIASHAQCINDDVHPGQNCSRAGVRLQNLESCSSYYECQNGIVEKKYCFIGFQYSRWYQKCMSHRFAHCKTHPVKTTTTTTPAPGTPSGEYDVCPIEGALLPNPVDCTTYYKCVNNTPTLQKCPDGQAYSCWDQKCEIDTKAVCIATGSHDGANCTVDKLRLHNLENCGSYYECINGKTVQKHCPPGEEFNDRFQKCYKPVLAHCQTYSTLPTSTATPSSTRTPSPENDICPVDGTLLPNPVNCSTYFKCINGTPTPQLCADGYEYNCWNQECEPKGIAQCISEGSQPGKSCKKNGNKNQDPTNCHGYLECVNNVIVHKHCPFNWWYSRWFTHCLPLKILAHCNEITTIAPVTTSLTTVKPTGSNECPSEGTVIPNPNDCSTYLKCIKKKPTIENCPKGQNYSAYDQQCKNGSEVTCINDGNPPQGRKCSRDGVRIQNLVDCTSFYECKDGIVQKYYCFIGFKYNRWYQKCEFGFFSHCKTYSTHAPPKTTSTPKTSTPSTTTAGSLTSTVRYPNAKCSRNGVKVPNIKNCNQYYYCSGITPVLYNCPRGQNYDAWQGNCAPVSQAKCINNPQSWVGGRCTMKKETVPDATSCQKYYICRGHKIRSARCPGFRQYDVWQGRCLSTRRLLYGPVTCANKIV